MENTNLEISMAHDFNIPQIVQLINKQAIHDKDKIVILPEKFRMVAIQNDVAKNRLYVAKDFDKIVAFKKLFIVNDQKEFSSIAQEELPCVGTASTLVAVECWIASICTRMLTMPSFSLRDSAIIYCGADFTHPQYRNQKINSCLMEYALSYIQGNVIHDIKTNKKNQIALLYGLTKINAGEQGGIDRTPSIIKAFNIFAQKVASACNHYGTNFLYHGQYNSFMPTFDPKNETCTPLPDNQAIAGYRNVLIYSFSKEVK